MTPQDYDVQGIVLRTGVEKARFPRLLWRPMGTSFPPRGAGAWRWSRLPGRGDSTLESVPEGPSSPLRGLKGAPRIASEHAGGRPEDASWIVCPALRMRL